MAAESVGQVLAGMELPWEATQEAGADVCGNYSLLAALNSAATETARLPPAARPAARLQALMKQLHEPIPTGLPPVDPVARTQRAAAREDRGPVTEDTVFEPQSLHFKIPHGYWLREAAAVGVDSEDYVYVFNRGNMPLLIFDPEGNLVNGFQLKGKFRLKDCNCSSCHRRILQ